MELHTINGRLKLGSAFKLVATGYLFGAGAIFIPLFTLVALITAAGGLPTMVNGQVVEGTAGVLLGLLPIVMVPVIVAVQAVIFGGFVVFGLWLYQKRRPLLVVPERDFEETHRSS